MFIFNGDFSECSGCMVCVYSCPTNSLSTCIQSDGFVYPVLDKNRCINCKKCENLCPNIKTFKNHENSKIYAFTSKNKAEMLQSSSGGLYPILSKKIIDKNGAVYAVQLDSSFSLKYVRITSYDQIAKTQGSKYFQCVLSKEIFSQIENDLMSNINVLFVGTPCQVAAINKRFGKYNNLITVDFVCHGVPSEMLFRSYVEFLEKKHNGKMIKIEFRNKEKYDWSITLHYIIKRGNHYKKYYLSHKTSSYFIAFLHGLSLRESCYHCKYCDTFRPSDITMADFWGIEKASPSFYNSDGVSMVLTNTKKGNELLTQINDGEAFVNDVTESFSGTEFKNTNLAKPTFRKSERDNIYNDLNKYGYSYIEKKYLKSIVSKKELIIAKIPFALRKRIKKFFKR